MKLQSKKLYSDVLSELVQVESNCSLDSEKTSGLKNAVDNMPLLVPVVGEFSAGKSSLLNACMGKNILSVAIAPETAKPAELYYSETEYDESVDSDGNVIRINCSENLPQDCVCVRRYINSEFLKKIQPIVLVDMPGFDSPHDAHNKAIFSYLDKGCHYIVLTPVDAGTVSRSMTSQIQNILAFKKDCSFFLSKCDLRSENEILEVKETLEDQLESIIGIRTHVSRISQKDVSMFESFATGLNADEVFKKQFEEIVKDNLYDAKDSINTKIAALKNDKAKNARAIEELKFAQEKLKAKKEKMIAEAKSKNYSDEAETVANAVGRELNSQLDGLAEVAISGGQSALEDEINSIAQTTVTAQMQSVMQNLSVKFAGEFSKEIKNLSETLADFGTPDALGKIQNVAQNIFDTSKSNIDAFIKDKKRGGANATISTAIAGVLAVATNIVSPIIEVILIMLPTVLNLIFGKSQEQRQRAEIRSKISAQIPSIKRSIREKVSSILKENGERIVQQISEKFDGELKVKEEEINAAIEEMDNDKDIENKIVSYQAALKSVDNLLNKIL